MPEKKRVILNIPADLLKLVDEDVKKLGLPSRNSYVEQSLRYQVGLPNIFKKEGSDG